MGLFKVLQDAAKPILELPPCAVNSELHRTLDLFVRRKKLDDQIATVTSRVAEPKPVGHSVVTSCVDGAAPR